MAGPTSEGCQEQDIPKIRFQDISRYHFAFGHLPIKSQDNILFQKKVRKEQIRDPSAIMPNGIYIQHS